MNELRLIGSTLPGSQSNGAHREGDTPGISAYPTVNPASLRSRTSLVVTPFASVPTFPSSTATVLPASQRTARKPLDCPSSYRCDIPTAVPDALLRRGTANPWPSLRTPSVSSSVGIVAPGAHLTARLPMPTP